jgi:hypothetical protein
MPEVTHQLRHTDNSGSCPAGPRRGRRASVVRCMSRKRNMHRIPASGGESSRTGTGKFRHEASMWGKLIIVPTCHPRTRPTWRRCYPDARDAVSMSETEVQMFGLFGSSRGQCQGEDGIRPEIVCNYPKSASPTSDCDRKRECVDMRRCEGICELNAVNTSVDTHAVACSMGSHVQRREVKEGNIQLSSIIYLSHCIYNINNSLSVDSNGVATL